MTIGLNLYDLECNPDTDIESGTRSCPRAVSEAPCFAVPIVVEVGSGSMSSMLSPMRLQKARETALLQVLPESIIALTLKPLSAMGRYLQYDVAAEASDDLLRWQTSCWRYGGGVNF